MNLREDKTSENYRDDHQLRSRSIREQRDDTTMPEPAPGVAPNAVLPFRPQSHQQQLQPSQQQEGQEKRQAIETVQHVGGSGDLTAWTTALELAKTELGPKRFAKVAAHFGDYNTCLGALQNKNNRFSSKWKLLGPVVSKLLEILNTFDKAISTCCQSYAQTACLVWGGVQAVLTVAAKYEKCAVRVADMLSRITLEMPRFEDYMSFFPSSGRLRARLVSIYQTFVVFCAKAFRFLDSRMATVLIYVTWSALDQQFDSVLKTMRYLKDEMENEASAENIRVGFAREEAAATRHKAMMAILPAVVDRRTAARGRCLSEPAVIVSEPRNHKFVGRTNELGQLQHEFSVALRKGLTVQASGRTSTSEPYAISICGQGGVGKTQLALEFLYQNQPEYRGRFWIRAENKEIIQQDFAQIGHLVLTEKKEENKDSTDAASEVVATDLNKAIKAARDWLETTSDTWLLVFDNVDVASYIQEYLPKVGHGSIIVTTRDHDTADALGQFNKIEVEGMEGADASRLLHQMIPHVVGNDTEGENQKDADPIIGDILEELGGLPLFICQMGSYIRQTKCTPSQFNDILQSHSDRLYSDKASVATLPYSKTLARCCNMSIDLLSDGDRYLFSILALFQTAEIQEELITIGCRSISRLQHLADEYDWNNAVRNLAKNSLIKVSQGSGGRVKATLNCRTSSGTPKTNSRNLHMHRVMKRHALNLLSADATVLGFALADAAHLLNIMFPRRPEGCDTMGKMWTQCELWLPHVLSLKDVFMSTNNESRQSKIPRAYAEILCNCSWYMWERGMKNSLEFAVDALDICCEALSYDDRNHEYNGEGDTLLSDMYTMVGALRMPTFQLRHESLHAFQEALRILQSIAQARTARGESLTFAENQLLANAYNNAGAGNMIVSDWEEARRMFEQAEALKNELGDETKMPYDFALARYNRCRLAMEQGIIDEALIHGCRAAELITSSMGPEDYRTLEFRFTYADLLVAVGDIEAGLQLHKDILDIRLRVVGRQNSDTAVSYYGLSCVYQKLKQPSAALKCITEAINIFAAEDGAEGRLARAYFRRKLIHADLGQYPEAEAAYNKAKEYVHILVGNEKGMETMGDTMESYDVLVSYDKR
ncbi:pfs domain-containing protein [Ophiostoma piceae UAMH 11346]|uniref:Pfs domain-containing protein n=1 Tax=Ophiostoma piceae (strain UAMH 11346) TaxID=1262450 RepID=S3BT69_OPHP1|nr:pfs domain-containing protein [Ophiostoma piceae UAMH 11346]